MPVDELVAAIRAAAAAVRKVRATMEQAQQLTTECRDTLRNATVGAGAPEPAEAMNHLGQALDGPESFAQRLAGLEQAASRLDGYAAHLEGAPSEPGQPPPTGSTAQPQARPPTSTPFTNSHGDSYPREAADLAARLPARVTPGASERTHAVARSGGTIFPTVTSGADSLTDATERLLREHGCTEKQAEYLKYHAEIKVAELVLRRDDLTDVEVAINYTPCGVERQQEFAATCDKLLNRIFPRHGARSLTVYGTYQDNRPYKTRYGRPQP
ncbi:SCP1.201-like deaminase [Amycolatopsis australiensis]|uniref:SCP1.201-like deaminase n=1 Tax=Amycolatopsis australiensis TaxID=546364 RepID=A0A1K1LPV5_9PSEU|nr:SCP1.201-like deaminase [Amycolatopsis australiensis]